MTELTDESKGGYRTKSEIAEQFQVTVRTIDQWMKSGRLPYFKIARTVRFRVRDIEASLDQTSRVQPHNAGTVSDRYHQPI